MLTKIRSFISGAPLLPDSSSSVIAKDSAPRIEPHWPIMTDSTRPGLKIDQTMLDRFSNAPTAVDWAAKFKRAEVAPNTVSKEQKLPELAMDSMCANMAETIGIRTRF